jgi:hypothetical protein
MHPNFHPLPSHAYLLLKEKKDEEERPPIPSPEEEEDIEGEEQGDI